MNKIKYLKKKLITIFTINQYLSNYDGVTSEVSIKKIILFGLTDYYCFLLHNFIIYINTIVTFYHEYLWTKTGPVRGVGCPPPIHQLAKTEKNEWLLLFCLFKFSEFFSSTSFHKYFLYILVYCIYKLVESNLIWHIVE